MVVLFPVVATAAALDFAVIVLVFVVTYVRRVHATVCLSLSLSFVFFFFFFSIADIFDVWATSPSFYVRVITRCDHVRA